MRLILFIAFLLVTTAATAPVRADYGADYKLILKLETAMRNSDVPAVKTLVAAPNFRPLLAINADYPTVFERALSNEQPEIARAMMNSAGWKRTRWNARNTAMPLIHAASWPSLFPILRDLSRQKGFDLNTPGAPDGEFPLIFAAQKGNMPALKWLIKQPQVQLNRRNNAGQNALYEADEEATDYLLSLHRMDINARDKFGQTALHSAAGLRQWRKVRSLLEAPGIDPNIRDNNRVPRTALDFALSRNSFDVVEALMESPKVRRTPAQIAQFKRMGGAL